MIMQIKGNKIEEIIARDGVFVSTTSGTSMKPMLRDRRDTVVIVPVKGRLKKYDVALYRSGEKYLLHRVVKVLPDSYVFCGDNRVVLEKGIGDDDVIGRLSEVWRGEKKLDLDGFGYKFYSRARVATLWLRRIAARIRRVFRRG